MKRNREFGKSFLWVREKIQSAPIDDIRRSPADFTRKRKIGLSNTLVQILCSERTAMESEIFETSRRTGMEPVSRTAMTNAREKIRPEFLKGIFDGSAESFSGRNRGKLRLFRGYRLLAVDGCKIAVRPDCDESGSFCPKNVHGKEGGREYEISALFDVINHYILNVDVSRRCDEHEMARNQMEWLAGKREEPTIVVFDRGYPDARMMTAMAERGLYYVIRLNSAAFKKEQRLLGSESGDIVTEKEWDIANTNYYRGDSEFREYLLTHPMKIRLVRFRVGNGTIETLATNISPAAMDTRRLREIYHLRWEIETVYRDTKQRYFLSRMTGRKIQSMRLDLWSSLLCANLMLMSVWETEHDNRKRLARKKPRIRKSGAVSRIVGYRISRTGTSRILRQEDLFPRLVTGKWVPDKILSQTEERILGKLTPVRPGRSYERVFHFDPRDYSYRY